MKSSAWFEPDPVPATVLVPAPVKTFEIKSLFVNEKLKTINLSF